MDLSQKKDPKIVDQKIVSFILSGRSHLADK